MQDVVLGVSVDEPCLNFRFSAYKSGTHVVTCPHSSTMAQAIYVFHLYGDSNVHKFLPVVKAAKSDPAVKNATYTRVTNSVTLREELTKPTTCHGTIIISAMTNLITSSQFVDYDTLSTFSNQTFNDVL
jgi:hypothetical protein